MNYEEKYKKAFERAVNIYGASETKDVLQTLETIFPELKKSEDEIFKELLHNLIISNDYTSSSKEIFSIYGKTKEDCIDWIKKQGKQKPVISYDALREGITFGITQYQIDNWLKKYVDVEKQCEKKSTDKVEPKFKVGDWVVIQGTAYQITKVENLNVTLYLNGRECLFDIDVLKNAHLWTIQDAKDGDVLTTKDAVFIFKHMDVAGLSLCRSYCEVIGNSKLGLGFDFPIQTVHPATKEQRNFLFKKIKEEGYEWDAEKKELKKIEQKPTWSEEDKNIEKISEYTTVEKDMDEYNKGFECGKQRVLKYPEDFNLCEKSASDWSEEDERNLEEIIDEIEANKNDAPDYDLATYDRFLSWLKSIKERMKGE